MHNLHMVGINTFSNSTTNILAQMFTRNSKTSNLRSMAINVKVKFHGTWNPVLMDVMWSSDCFRSRQTARCPFLRLPRPSASHLLNTCRSFSYHRHEPPLVWLEAEKETKWICEAEQNWLETWKSFIPFMCWWRFRYYTWNLGIILLEGIFYAHILSQHFWNCNCQTTKLKLF